MNRRRAKLAALYRQGLEGTAGIDLPGIPDYPHVHSWHLFIVKVLSMDREMFMRRLSEYNIGYGLHFPAGHRLTYLRKTGKIKTRTLKETDRCAEKILSLPLYPGMKNSDVHYVCDAIKEILRHG